MTREGYPGLVVHGPLVAVLLAELVRGPLVAADRCVCVSAVCARLFDLAPFRIIGILEGSRVQARGPRAGRQDDDDGGSRAVVKTHK